MTHVSTLAVTAIAVAASFGLAADSQVFNAFPWLVSPQAFASPEPVVKRVVLKLEDCSTADEVRDYFGYADKEPAFGTSAALQRQMLATRKQSGRWIGEPQARAGDDITPDDLATMTDEDLEENVERFEQLIGVINGGARNDDRKLTAREERRLDAAEESLALYRAEQTSRASRAPRGRRTNPERIDQQQETTTRAQANGRSHNDRLPVAPRRNDPGTAGFASAGEYFAAVLRSSASGAQHDPRLVYAAAPNTMGSEGVGADGGFAVPPDFRAAIMSKVFGEDSLLSLTDQQLSSSNSITFPADETTPWQQSGGIQAFWEVEGGLKTQSKPALTEKTVKLNKIIALVPMTDELLEDAPAMASYVNRKAPEKIYFRLNDAILNGSGVGMPLGILTSPGTVVVPKESGQAADTVNYMNITKLWAAVTPSARRNARWLLHPDVESQLMALAFPGAGTAVPAYLPPGGLSAAPYGTLLGRPIFYSEAAQPLGDQGDIVFGDLANYLTANKAGGIKSDVSIHLWFDYDLTAFRFVLRVGGQPWWNAPVAPYQAGASTRGFFSTLATRA